MIAKLKGLVDSTGVDWVILDVGGVGYKAFASARTLRLLPPEGQAAMLHIETHVREDHIHLYGFIDAAEHEWFLLLGSVQGIGGKAALAILSVVEPQQLAQVIAAEDKAMLTRADGIGPKIATRIITELKDKASKMTFAAPQNSAPLPKGKAAAPAAGGAVEEAISALVNLGYQRLEAFQAVHRAAARADGGAPLPTGELIRAALQELAA